MTEKRKECLEETDSFCVSGFYAGQFYPFIVTPPKTERKAKGKVRIMQIVFLIRLLPLLIAFCFQTQGKLLISLFTAARLEFHLSLTSLLVEAYF